MKGTRDGFCTKARTTFAVRLGGTYASAPQSNIIVRESDSQLVFDSTQIEAGTFDKFIQTFAPKPNPVHRTTQSLSIIMTKRERYAATVAQYLEELQKAIERNEVGIHEAYFSDTVFEIHVRNEHGDIMESATQSISIWEGFDELTFNAQGHITNESVSVFFRNNADYMPPPFLLESELERAHKVEFVVDDKMVSGEWDSFVLSISITI